MLKEVLSWSEPMGFELSSGVHGYTNKSPQEPSAESAATICGWKKGRGHSSLPQAASHSFFRKYGDTRSDIFTASQNRIRLKGMPSSNR